MRSSSDRPRNDVGIPSATFRSALDRLVEDVASGALSPAGYGYGPRLVPAINLRETDNAVVAEVELPGLNEEDITVQVLGDVLAIRAERHRENEEEGTHFYRREIASGVLERQIPLPLGVDPDGVEATYGNGLLRVRLPRVEGAKAKTVPVKVRK
jgi:HSP20 family protein